MRRWLLIGALLVAAPIIASLPLLSVTAPRDTSQEILLRILADGAVELWQGPDEHTRAQLPFPADGFDLEDESRSARTVELLRTRLRELAAPRSDTGQSSLALRIEAAPRIPVRFVIWAIIVGAEPGTLIGDYQLSTRGRQEVTVLTLPDDRRRGIELRPIEMAILFDVGGVDEAGMLGLTISTTEDIDVVEEQRDPWRDESARTITSLVDADGTPLGIGGVTTELARLRALVPEQPEVIVELSGPDPAVVLAARTMIDLMAAINGVEGLRLQMVGRLLPRSGAAGR